MARRAAKVDDNQSEVVNTFRTMGCCVLPLHTVGGGCPDLLVEIATLNVLVEVKDGKKKPSARELTDPQKKFHKEWRGHKEIIKNLDEAQKVVRKYRHIASQLKHWNDAKPVAMTEWGGGV